MTRSRFFFAALIVVAYLAGFFAGGSTVPIKAQQQPSRFVLVGNDGPFKMWKDTRSNQCFIVTTPYFAMLALQSC